MLSPPRSSLLRALLPLLLALALGAAGGLACAEGAGSSQTGDADDDAASDASGSGSDATLDADATGTTTSTTADTSGDIEPDTDPDVPVIPTSPPPAGTGNSAGGTTLTSSRFTMRVVVGGPQPSSAVIRSPRFRGAVGVAIPQVAPPVAAPGSP